MVRNGDTDDGVRRLIERYLQEVDEALVGVPAAQRREILEDLRAHIDASLAAAGGRDEATVRTILDRLGSPEELARETRERLGVPEPMPVAQAGPGLLEYAAIVLTALFWPVGILLAWLSPMWRTRDKVIATLIGCLAIVVAVVGLMAFRVGSTTAVQVQQVDVPAPVERPGDVPSVEREPSVETTPTSVERVSKSSEWWDVPVRLAAMVMGMLVLFSPFLSALYLAIRLRRPRRAAPRANPVLA